MAFDPAKVRAPVESEHAVVVRVELSTRGKLPDGQVHGRCSDSARVVVEYVKPNGAIACEYMNVLAGEIREFLEAKK